MKLSAVVYLHECEQHVMTNARSAVFGHTRQSNLKPIPSPGQQRLENEKKNDLTGHGRGRQKQKQIFETTDFLEIFKENEIINFFRPSLSKIESHFTCQDEYIIFRSCKCNGFATWRSFVILEQQLIFFLPLFSILCCTAQIWVRDTRKERCWLVLFFFITFFLPRKRNI